MTALVELMNYNDDVLVKEWRQDSHLCNICRLVNGYGMIGMIGIPKEYGRYMHQYTYSMHIC